MAAQEQVPIYKEMSDIIGAPAGPAHSVFQITPHAGSDWMQALQGRGISPELHAPLERRLRRKAGPNTLTGRILDRDLRISVTNHCGSILAKVENEMQHRGVEGRGYVRFNSDARDLHRALDNPGNGGDAFIEGMVEATQRAEAMGIDPLWMVNQYSGMADADVRNRDLTRGNFQSIDNVLGERLPLQPINDIEPDFIQLTDETVKMGGTRMRLSLELGKIFPEPGVIDEQEFEKYRQWIDHAHEVGVEPALCLTHFTLPAWLEGGFGNPDSPKLFADAAMEVLTKLKACGSLPDRIMTINEPMATISGGFIDGVWPPFSDPVHPLLVGLHDLFDLRIPGEKRTEAYVRAMENSLDAHVAIYDRVKELTRDMDHDIPVGFTYNLPTYSPMNKYDPTLPGLINLVDRANYSWFDKLLKRSEERGQFLFDEVDLQYYNAFDIGWLKRTLKDTAYAMNITTTEEIFPNGWRRNPEGLFVQMLQVSNRLMRTAQKLGVTDLPDIAIGETGVPSNVDPRSELRINAQSIRAAKDLLLNRVPSACFWNPKDGLLEWSSGFTPAFGFTRADGSPKPQPTREPQPLNLNKFPVLVTLKQYQKQLEQFERHLQAQGGPAADAEFKKDKVKQLLQSIEHNLLDI